MNSVIAPIEPVEFYATDVKKFLDFLSKPDDEFCYCWMDAESKDRIKGFGVCFGGIDKIQSEYGKFRANQIAPTLHVTLNQTNDRGRKDGDIQAPRVLCVDLDRVVTDEEIRSIRDKDSPHLIVKSSPNRYHLYWKVNPSLSLEVWQILQAGLAVKYGGDPALSKPTKMIRVPGLVRVCKDGTTFLPQIVYELLGAAPIEGVDGLSDVVALGEKALQDNQRGHHKSTRKGLKGRPPKKLVEVGNRNDSLYHDVHEFVFTGNGDVTMESTLAYAESVNADFPEPLEFSEVQKTAESAFKNGMAARQKRALRAAKTLEAAREALGVGEQLEFKYNYESTFLKSNRFSTHSMVERVLQRFHNHIVKIGKDVYAFDTAEKVWTPQKGDEAVVTEYVKACSDDMVKEPEFLQKCCNGKGELIPGKIDSQIEKYHGAAYLGGATSGVLKAKLPKKSFTNFDADPELLYCANGVLNMVTRELREARAEDYLLYRTGVAWDGQAECPRWCQFVQDVYRDNEDSAGMYQYLQEIFGYSLTGSISAQKIFIHVGGGSNGKSNVFKTLMLIAGNYHSTINCKDITKTKGGFEKELDRTTAKMEGRRVMIIDDLDTNSQWNEGVVKTFTGDVLATRNLYSEARSIPNRAKFHIGCNEAPKPEGESEGIIRRLSFINYERYFEPDPAIQNELDSARREEASGILRWSVEGLQRLVLQGWKFSEPAECKMYQEEYRHDEFKVETSSLEIFEPETGDESDRNKWHPIETLLDDMRQRLGEIGALDRMPNKKKLQDLLTRNLKVKVDRHRVDGIKKRFYFVKRLYTPMKAALNLIN